MGYLPFTSKVTGRTFRIRVDTESASVLCEESSRLWLVAGKIPGGFFLNTDELCEVNTVLVTELLECLHRTQPDG